MVKLKRERAINNSSFVEWKLKYSILNDGRITFSSIHESQRKIALESFENTIFKETIKTSCGTILERAQPTLQCRIINKTHRRRLFNAKLIAFRRFWMDESMNICIQPHSMLYVLAWSFYMLNHTHWERDIYIHVRTYVRIFK